MSSAYRPIVSLAAAMPLIASRPAVRALRQAAPRAAATALLVHSTMICQCGAGSGARFVTSRATSRNANRSPTVRRAERRQRPTASGQTQQTGSGGPMSSSVFPAEPSILLPALEVASNMLGPIMTEDEFLTVVTSAAKIVDAHRPVSEAELASDYNITPYQLHMAAVAVLIGNKVVSDHVPSLFIALTLMHLATASVKQRGGYLPSTLTLVNMIGAQWPQSNVQAEAMRKTSIYKNAERQFLSYLNKKNSDSDSVADGEPLSAQEAADEMALQADAFTLAGVLAEASGEPERALQWYLAARELGNASAVVVQESEESAEREAGKEEEKPKDEIEGQPMEDIVTRDIKWNWEQRCLEGIGRLYADEMKQAAKADGGNTNDLSKFAGTEEYMEARTALRTAAKALCSGKAGYLLATDYASAEDSSEDQDMMLHLAAIHNIPGTYAALSQREATKASVLRGLNSSKVTEDAEFHQMMADEWQTLAEAAKPVPW